MILLLATAAPARAQRADAGAGGTPAWTIELEAGPAWQSYNDVEIPNDGTATRFSLQDVAGSGPWPAGRVYVTWRVAERHALRLLAAPLTLRETGALDAPVSFTGESFTPGAPVDARYTFNSYRLSYRYRMYEGAATTLWLGVTAKLRDAVIELEQGGTRGRKTDLGFVPLLHLAGDWRLASRWALGLDVDALAGGPGRAEDVALELGYELSPRWSVQGGYRFVEGGADVDEVYTFAWLHYATVSLLWRLAPMR